MKSALKKALVGLAVAIGLFAALFVPGLLGDRPATELATQSLSPVESEPAAPAAAPTEIVLPSPTVEVPTATAVVPTSTPTPMPTAIVIVAPTPSPTPEPTIEPTPEPVIVESADATPATPVPVVIDSTPVPAPTDVPPTVAPTPTEEPTASPTAVPTATTEPTVEPTVEPTAEPTVEPTAVPTAEPTPTATPTEEPTTEPTVDPGPNLAVEATWMYVTSTDGLFLRDVPAGQITNVLTYRSEVHVTGAVEANGDRLWAQVDIPEAGWVALAFLSVNQPAPPATVPGGGDRPSEPPTDADWNAFRNCESGGRYDVVDPSGLYHGAYQFLPSTWDGLARRFWPELVGVLPSQASPADQDKMALKLFELEGARPWPTCGLHLL